MSRLHLILVLGVLVSGTSLIAATTSTSVEIPLPEPSGEPAAWALDASGEPLALPALELPAQTTTQPYAQPVEVIRVPGASAQVNLLRDNPRLVLALPFPTLRVQDARIVALARTPEGDRVVRAPSASTGAEILLSLDAQPVDSAPMRFGLAEPGQRTFQLIPAEPWDEGEYAIIVLMPAEADDPTRRDFRIFPFSLVETSP